MFLGQVIGTVWATKKDPKLEGVKFQIVRRVEELVSHSEVKTTMVYTDDLNRSRAGALFGA